jgi:hypothetical protein
MTNTTGTKGTKTSVDAVVEEAAKEKLVSEVPAQGGKDEKTAKTEEPTTGEKDADAPEVEEKTKKSVKDRLKALGQKAKDNRSFFMGVVTGAAGTALVMALAAKEKVEEVVELAIADEPEPEVEGDTDDTTV